MKYVRTRHRQYSPRRPTLNRSYVEQWQIPSHSDPTKTYTVSLTDQGEYQCSCPHWKFRRQECKHIREAKAKLRSEQSDINKKRVEKLIEEAEKKLSEFPYIINKHGDPQYTLPISEEMGEEIEKNAVLEGWQRTFAKNVGKGVLQTEAPKEGLIISPDKTMALVQRDADFSKHGSLPAIGKEIIDSVTPERLDYNSLLKAKKKGYEYLTFGPPTGYSHFSLDKLKTAIRIVKKSNTYFSQPKYPGMIVINNQEGDMILIAANADANEPNKGICITLEDFYKL